MRITSIILIIFFLGLTRLFSQSYLPIEANNKWYFDHGDCTGSPIFSQCNKSVLISNVTADSLMPNGFRYYKVHGIFFGFSEWFRSDTDWVYIYSFDDSLGYVDLPIFNLHANIGDIYNYGTDEYQNTTLRNRSTMNIFDTNVEILEFVLETGLDATFEFTLSNKFGFIKYNNIGYGGWSYSNLIGCVVNGQTYGDVTNVEQVDNIIPQLFELSQNYPNPFNPATNISFNLPSAQKAQLTVYDITGKEIAVILDESLSAGYHNIIFNGNNLSSGIYFYRLKTNNYSETKKMILLK